MPVLAEVRSPLYAASNILDKRNAMPAPQLLLVLCSLSATRRTNCHQSCSCRASGATRSVNPTAAQ